MALFGEAYKNLLNNNDQCLTSPQHRAEIKWDRLPACRAENDRLEAYPTFSCDTYFPHDAL